ncbi:hypothetical protein Dda_1183 [Drechslerella dactyloides]|uniref:Uncharacterized protein n=1 Tax=Drechslerella dactyloides TaxID=74499 RepID=A0AAD6NPJ1_DREDA|nr:hypothetical protein Dda_1183 [Drechslerella dactyloides]
MAATAPVLHRRISLSDIGAPGTVTAQPGAQLPPKYSEYKPGCRDEFFRDIREYQAAAQIHAHHRQAASTSSPTAASPTADADSADEAPSYDSIGHALPTIHETKVFRRRLLETLRGIREFIERSRRTLKWSNCFGLSEKVQIILAGFLLLCIVGGIAAMGVKYQQVAGLLALAIFFLVHVGTSFFIIRKYMLKRRLIEALQVGLAKVEQFEKIDDRTLRAIKKGVADTLNPMFWMDRERMMEEAIPEAHREPPPPPLSPPPPAHLEEVRSS